MGLVFLGLVGKREIKLVLILVIIKIKLKFWGKFFFVFSEIIYNGVLVVIG